MAETAFIRGQLNLACSLIHTGCTCVYLLALVVKTEWLNKVAHSIGLLKLHAWPQTFNWLRGWHWAKCQNVLQRKTLVSQLSKVYWGQPQIWCWEINFIIVYTVIFSCALRMLPSISQSTTSVPVEISLLLLDRYLNRYWTCYISVMVTSSSCCSTLSVTCLTYSEISWQLFAICVSQLMNHNNFQLSTYFPFSGINIHIEYSYFIGGLTFNIVPASHQNG